MTGGDAVLVPPELAASHVRYSGEAGRRWAAALPGLAAQLLEQWGLRVDGPSAYGAVALVLPVRRADGSPAVLKLQPVDQETVGEASALARWDGHGAVRLLAHDPSSGSMLLERLDASRSLHSVPDDLAAIAVIADLLVELNAVPAPASLRVLGEVLRPTLEGVVPAVALLGDDLERRLLQECAARLREVLAEPVGSHLLHWDLHYANVLAALDEPARWVAIDPKPLAGDPGFELLPALWNRWGDVVRSTDPAASVLRRFDVMTERLGLDQDRAVAWTLGRVLQDAVWGLTLLGEPRIRPEHRTIAEVLIQRRGRSRRSRSAPVQQ